MGGGARAADAAAPDVFVPLVVVVASVERTTRTQPRLPLPAPVTPRVAGWILRAIGEERLRNVPHMARAAGEDQFARQLEQSIAMLRESDRQYREWLTSQVSAGESAEVVQEEIEASSGSCPPTRLTSTEAAGLSGLTASRIRQLCRDQVLVAVRWGQSWSIDRDSLQDYLSVRRAR